MTPPPSKPISRPLGPRLMGHLAVLAAILVGWFVAMAVSARFLPMTDAYLVVGPERAIVDGLPEQAQILRTSRHTVVVSLAGASAAASLYQAGAWVVLPALANGCLALRSGGTGRAGSWAVAKPEAHLDAAGRQSL